MEEKQKMKYYHEYNASVWDDIREALFEKKIIEENTSQCFMEYLDRENVFVHKGGDHHATMKRWKDEGKIPFYRLRLFCKACHCSPLYFERVTDQWGHDLTPKRPVLLVDDEMDPDFALSNFWCHWREYRKSHPGTENIQGIHQQKYLDQPDIRLIDFLHAPIWNERKSLALKMITLGDITLETMFDKEMDRVTLDLRKEIENLESCLEAANQKVKEQKAEDQETQSKIIAKMRSKIVDMMKSERQLWNIDNLRTIKEWLPDLKERGLLSNEQIDRLLGMLERILGTMANKQ